MSNTEEIWKDIKGYEEKYQVSSLGNVRRLAHYGGRQFVEKGKGKGRRFLSEKTVAFNMTTPGYYSVGLCAKKHQVHRLVAKAFIPNPENKREVNHINGIKTDNRVSNLEWVTPSENIRHAIKSGAIKTFGENNHFSKLTTDKVRVMKYMLSRGIRRQWIAKWFEVTIDNVKHIHNGKTWKHVTV